MQLSEPVLLAFSGGKDSIMALAALAADPGFTVVGLLATVDRDDDRLCMHGVPLSLISAQARALGMPLRVMRVPPGADDRAYRNALEEALDEARMLHPALSHIAFGDLHLADIRAWREALADELGWTAVFPLWGSDTGELAQRVVAEGWKARLMCVDGEQLDPALLGREYDADLLADLPPDCDPCGENGEFHTFVHDGPDFDMPVAARAVGMTSDGRFHRLVLEPALN